MKGKVEGIHIAPKLGAPVEPLSSVEAVAGVGLRGDRYAQNEGHWKDGDVSRNLTLIEAEEIERVAAESSIHLAPGETRRNLTTRGIRLNELVGKEFWIGSVRARGTKLCEPCQYISDLTGKPLVKAMVHRAGIRADILSSGQISVGDEIREA